MPDVTASRTLVKSAPELWTECSDADSLGRHLDQFGDIRITRLEPETAVAWEGELASGTVRLEPSGWGTRVVLTATAAPSPDGAAQKPEPPEAGALVVSAPAPAAAEPAEPSAAEPLMESEVIAAERDSEPEPLDPEPVAAGPEAAAWPGFFVRLFGRWRSRPASPVTEVETAQEPQPVLVAPEPVVLAPASGLPQPEQEPQPAAAAVASAGAAEAERPPDPEALLVAALDSLGQAHHRPYSRA
jgi:hypothetical protein